VTIFSVDFEDEIPSMAKWTPGKLLSSVHTLEGVPSAEEDVPAPPSWSRAATTLSEKKWEEEESEGVVSSYRNIAELAAQLRITAVQCPSLVSTSFFASLTQRRTEVFLAIAGATDVFSVMRALASVSQMAPLNSHAFRDEEVVPQLALAWYDSECSWANRQPPISSIDLKCVFDARVIHSGADVKVLVQHLESRLDCAVEADDEVDGAVRRSTKSGWHSRQEVEFIFPSVTVAEEWADHLNILCDIVNEIEP